MNVQQILCPVDFSGTSKRALEVASELARDTSAVLHIVHVNDGQSPELNGDEAQTELDAFFLTTPAGTNVTFQQHLLSGEPQQVIVDFIDNNQIDVVVIG
ncbi:MAG: universal stress protein, partial [Planctomycetota bacterium]